MLAGLIKLKVETRVANYMSRSDKFPIASLVQIHKVVEMNSRTN